MCVCVYIYIYIYIYIRIIYIHVYIYIYVVCIYIYVYICIYYVYIYIYHTLYMYYEYISVWLMWLNQQSSLGTPGLDATRWCHIYHGEANMSGRRWPVADPQKIRSCPMGQPGAKSRTDRFSKDLRDIRKISRVSKFSTSLHFLVISHQCLCGRSWMVWSLSCQFSVGFSNSQFQRTQHVYTCLYMLNMFQDVTSLLWKRDCVKTRPPVDNGGTHANGGRETLKPMPPKMERRNLKPWQYPPMKHGLPHPIFSAFFPS